MTRPSLTPKFILSSKRVRLEVLSPDHAVRVAEYHLQNKAFMKEYSPARADEYYTEDYWKLKLKELLEAAHLDQHYPYFLVQNSNDKIIGWVNFSGIARGPFQACYLGYNLSAGAEGFGFMNEALQLGINHMFEDLNFHRIMANYVPSNVKSEKVLNKLGFVKEGLAKDYLLINDVWRDHVLTSLTNKNWVKVE